MFKDIVVAIICLKIKYITFWNLSIYFFAWNDIPNEFEEILSFSPELFFELKENISLDGGLRYSKGRTSNNGTTYAAGINYNLSKDFKISAIYGPIDVLDDYSSDIFENKTDGIYGDDKQNIGSLKVSVKF